MLICGVDEARRGPVLGPMVMCGAVIEEKDLPKLEAVKPKDSKLMTSIQRESIFERLKSTLKNYKLVISPPTEIDDAVFGKYGLNLNKLEAKKTAEILNELNPGTAIIDCPSNNISAYKEYLSNMIKSKQIKLQLEHNAERYIIVAAASIIAKVTADREVEKIKNKIGIDFGSGYMSDPKTAKFLKEHYGGHAEIFRKSWAPYQKLVSEKSQSNLSDFSKFVKK